jgi:hypothetical protein
VADETGLNGRKRNDTTALLQLALAGIVLILLGLAASQARREPEDEAIPLVEDSTGYDFDDAIPPDDEPRDTMPYDERPVRPDTTLPDTPAMNNGAIP